MNVRKLKGFFNTNTRAMIRSFRKQPTSSSSISVFSLPNMLGRKSGNTSDQVSFRQVTTVSCKQQSQQDKDKDYKDDAPDPKQRDNVGDAMSHSFGEGYATRSDDDGFGGIYGRNESAPKDVHENHPGYDKNQGSEVKEKEKARHQTSVAS